MANASIEKQVDTTVKVLVTLLAEPKVKASQLAKATDQSPANIARLIGRFRDAGLSIDYDFSDESYSVDFTSALEKSVLGKYAKKMRRILSDTQAAKTPVKFVSSLERYTLPEFAEMQGTSPQNVYNMIIGYKGAHLPGGWVAYQMQDRGKWLIKKMTTDRTGKKFTVPKELDSAFKIVVGEGEELGRTQAIKRAGCAVHGCKERVLSKGLCSTHYYMARRTPDKFEELTFDRDEDDYAKMARDTRRRIRLAERAAGE